MARRVNPGGGANDTTEHDDATPLAGGSSGVLENAVTTVGGSGNVQASAWRAPPPDAPPPPVTKKYEVVGAGKDGRFALLNGYKALFRDGKVIDEAHWDIAALTAQGISLREIP